MKFSPTSLHWSRLVISLFAIGFVWLIVLPRIAQYPTVRARIEKNRAAGINPTAVFYTDHPGMGNIERSMAAHVDGPTRSFWKPSLHR
jgi:hypothetical protein